MASKAEKWCKKTGYDPDSVNPQEVQEACGFLVGPEEIPGLAAWVEHEGRITQYRAPNSLRTYVRSALKYQAAKELFDEARALHKEREKLF